MDATTIDILRRIMDANRAEIHGAMFCQVTRFHNTPGFPAVDCQPMTRAPVESLEGARSYESLPELINVPVMYPQAGSRVSFTWDLSPGDIVAVLVLGLDFSEWFISGEESNPIDGRTHALDNAIALPCGYSSGHGPTVVNNVLTVKAPEVRVGDSTAAFHAAIAEKVVTALNAHATRHGLHTHTAPPMGGPTSPPIPGGEFDPVTLSDVQSTVLKVSG